MIVSAPAASAAPLRAMVALPPGVALTVNEPFRLASFVGVRETTMRQVSPAARG